MHPRTRVVIVVVGQAVVAIVAMSLLVVCAYWALLGLGVAYKSNVQYRLDIAQIRADAEVERARSVAAEFRAFEEVYGDPSLYLRYKLIEAISRKPRASITVCEPGGGQ